MKTRISSIIWAVLAISCSDPGFAELPNNNPVPGGVAVVKIYGIHEDQPKIIFGNKSILTITEDNKLYAVVGLPQDILPGKYILKIESASDGPTKRNFKIDPLPAYLNQRTVNLPEKYNSLAFSLLDTQEKNLLVSNTAENKNSTDPTFIFHQLVSTGSYIPYGWLLKKQGEVKMIDHSWITYITKIDEIVTAPSNALVEQIFFSNSSGITVILDHGKGLKSIISYLNDTILKPGEPVESGDVIGITKTIKNMSIGRVDWQLMLNNYLIDPLQFSPSA